MACKHFTSHFNQTIVLDHGSVVKNINISIHIDTELSEMIPIRLFCRIDKLIPAASSFSFFPLMMN